MWSKRHLFRINIIERKGLRMTTGHCAHYRDTKTSGGGANILKDVKEIISLQPDRHGVEGLDWRE